MTYSSLSDGYLIFKKMDIEKILAIGIVACIISLLLKNKNPVFSVLVSLSAITVISLFSLSGLLEISDGFLKIFLDSGISKTHFLNIIKVISIAYATEIICSLLSDAGESSLAKNLELAGKIAVLILTIPNVLELMTVIIDALSLI